MSVKSAGWVVPAAKFLVVEKARYLLGLHWQETLGIKTTQVYNPDAKEDDEQDSPPTVASTETQNTDDWVSEKWKDYFSSKYADVFNRQGRSKSHVVTTNFNSPLIPIQEKGRQVPVHILNRVEKEIEKLMASYHIEKLEKCTNDFFIAPIVITAKKDGSIKLALDAKPINGQIFKNKYQMPVVEELMDSIGQIITDPEHCTEELWFTSLDLNYAYSQLPLSKEKKSKHCNFSIVGGRLPVLTSCLTGFYGLTDRPTEFQKSMDSTLINL